MTSRVPVVLLLLIVLLAAAAPAPAQDIPLSPRLSFRDATLHLRDGEVVRGRLTGATKDAVVIRRGGEDQPFAFADLRKVVIETEGRPSEGLVPGLAMGLYIGNGLMAWSQGQPGFYLHHIEAKDLASGWLLLGEAFFASVGAAAGWLVASGGGRYAFEFSADPGEALRGRERFVRFLAGEAPPARVHLLIQGGALIPGPSASFGEFMAAEGFTESGWSEPSTFSGLRGLELSASVKPRWRAGLRLSFPSEPHFHIYQTGTQDHWTSADQEVKATAVHSTVAFELVGAGRARRISLSAGLGAGIVAVRLTRRAWTTVMDGSGGGSTVVGTAEVRKTLPSAVVFGALQFPLTPVLSIGLAADYTFIPAVSVPALPDNGLPGQKTGLSNGSVGFVLGYHF